VQPQSSAVADAPSDQRVAHTNDHQRNRVTRDKDGHQKVVPLHARRRPALNADVLGTGTGSRRRSRLGGDVRSISGRQLGTLVLELLIEDRPRRHDRRRERPYQHDYDARHFPGHVTPQAVTYRQIPTER